MPSKSLAIVLLVLVLASVSHAQWSSDSAVNLTVADATGDQVQVKVAPTADGGCYLSWLDSLGNGFDVRVQKLDAAGHEVFPHNGVLVADRAFSWTMDYGLDTDASGNALITFRDDRQGGIQITAAKVSPTGALLWGTAGVQLTNTAGFLASPKIAGTSDGGAVVGWTEDSDARLQKLDAGGSPLWGPGVTLPPPAGAYTLSDLHDAGTDALLSIVHQTGEFFSPKHLLAQKLNASGGLLWGANHVAVFDGGSLQMGNFPPFVPDGLGGAVFSWYDTASLQLQSYAQHVLADGTEAFPHNGSAASTNASRIRVSPSAAFDHMTGETYLFWEEQNSSQSQSGLYGQKFDPDGNRQWTNDGVTIIPVGSDQISQVRCLVDGAGALGFWAQSVAFGQDRLYGARLDEAGTIDIAPFDVASTSSGKSRLDVARSAAGYAVLGWTDDRSDAGDILAQNVNSDGTLGGSGSGIVDGVDQPALVAFVSPHPNPSGGAASFEYMITGPVSDSDVIDIAIYDARGRVIRRWSNVPAVRRGAVSWDGCDRAGRRVPGGVYFLRATNGRSEKTSKVTIIR